MSGDGTSDKGIVGKMCEGSEVCGAIDGRSLSCKRGAEAGMVWGVCFDGKNRLIPDGKARTEVIVESCMFGVCLDKSKGYSAVAELDAGSEQVVHVVLCYFKRSISRLVVYNRWWTYWL